MIRYLTHNQIDKERWDKCIAGASNGNVYAWSWYLDVVHPKWQALVEDDYKRVMPLTGNRKFGINYLFQPFFTQQLGIFSKDELSSEIVENFINSIPPKFKFAEIRLNSHNKINMDLPYVEMHRNIEFDLIPDYQYIYDNYNSNTKRNLAKAKEANLYINKNTNPKDIIKLFRDNKGKEVKHWKDNEYQRLYNLVNAAVLHDSCFLYGSYNPGNNQLVAGAIFMYSHNRIVFLFSGASPSNREYHGLTFLIDQIINDFSCTERTLDFEGSDDYNLARFYKGFGGKEIYYPSIKLCKAEGLPKILLKLTKKI